MKPMKRNESLIKRLVVAAGGLWAGVACAAVETFEIGADGYPPPEEQMAPSWTAMVMALVALVVVLGPVFISAKRSHLN